MIYFCLIMAAILIGSLVIGLIGAAIGGSSFFLMDYLGYKDKTTYAICTVITFLVSIGFISAFCNYLDDFMARYYWRE